MKSIISKFLGAVLLLALPLSFTSCEDILGTWDKPVPADIPPAVITLKNALDAGAQVQISYKIGDTPHTATFLKEGDVYNLVGDGNPEEQMLTYDEANNRLIFNYLDDVSGFYVFFDIATASFLEVNTYGDLSSFDGNITIQGTTITLPNICPKVATIAVKNTGTSAVDFNFYINYAEGDTWQNVIDRLASYGFTTFFISINPENNEVRVAINTVKYVGGIDKVLKNHLVGKDKDGNAYNQDYEVSGIAISGGGTAPLG